MSSLPCRLALSGSILVLLAIQALSQSEVTVEFVSFPKAGEVPKLEVLVGEGKTQSIELPSHALSKPAKLPRLSSWKLGIAGKDAAGGFAFNTYGSVRPLTASRQVLVCLRRGKDLEDGLRIVAIDGSTQVFGEKKFLIMNLAAQEVAGELGGRQFRLPPAKYIIVQPAENRGKGLCFSKLMAQRKGKWRPFFSTNWPVLDESRALVFIFQQPGNATMQIHTIVDSLKVIPPPKSPE